MADLCFQAALSGFPPDTPFFIPEDL